jgi:hypothetical protein
MILIRKDQIDLFLSCYGQLVLFTADDVVALLPF